MSWIFTHDKGSEISIETSDGKIVIDGCGCCGSPYTSDIKFIHLMAAAPDLLEALENLENDDGRIPDHAWKMCQEAIAKAKGGGK